MLAALPCVVAWVRINKTLEAASKKEQAQPTPPSPALPIQMPAPQLFHSHSEDVGAFRRDEFPRHPDNVHHGPASEGHHDWDGFWRDVSSKAGGLAVQPGS